MTTKAEHKKRASGLVLGASAILLSVSAGVQALEPVAYDFDDDLILDEIIVTAQKRSKNAQSVPVSVVAYSEQALANSNITNFSDLNRLAAGLSVVDIGNGLGSTVRVRGVGQEAFGLTLQPSVAIIIDGIAQPRLDTAFASFLDIERVEVLRGPQGTLWGRNAPAGAITVTTREVDTVLLSGELRTVVGSDGIERHVAIGNIPIVEDLLAVRVSGFRDRNDGFIDLVTVDETNSSDREGGRVKMRFTPTDSLDISLSYERADIEARPARERVSYGASILDQAARAGVTLDMPDAFDNRSFSDNAARFSSTTETTILDASLLLNDHYELKLISGYQAFTNALTGEVETSPLDLFNVSRADNFDHNNSHELQLRYSDESMDWIAGLYYADIKQRNPTVLSAGADGLAVNDDAIVNFNGGGGPGDFITALTDLGLGVVNAQTNELLGLMKFTLVPDLDLQNRYSTFVRAAFGHLSASLSEDVTLDVGLRYSSETVASTNSSSGTFSFPVVPLVIPSGDTIAFDDRTTFESITGGVRLSVEFTDDMTVYGGIDRGYKAGGFNGAASPSISSNPATRQFDEEETLNFELGWKSEFLNNRLRSNGAIFLQTYDDYQVQIPDATTGTNLISNADVVVKGIEADITWLVSSGLTMNATLAYIDARYDDYSNGLCTTGQIAALAATPGVGNFLNCSQDLSDTRLNLSSRWSGNVGLLYESDYFQWGKQQLNWFAYAEAIFRDDFVGAPSNNPDTKTTSYTVGNLKTGLKAEHWEAELWVDNVGDKAYFTSLEEASFSDGTTAVIGPRRAAGVRMKLRL